MADEATPEEIDKLVKLLHRIEEELKFAANQYPEVAPKIFKDSIATDVWKEVEVAFLRAEKNLSIVSQEALRNHGLLDVALQSKISFLDKASAIVQEYFSKFPKLDLNRLRKLLAWFLGVLENLIESLANVAGPLGAVVEVKKQMESGLDFPEASE